MSITRRTILAIRDEYRSREVASFLAQLEDLTARLFDDLHDATTDELAWQVQPGANTIGMLLAHLAIVDVHWTQIGLRATEDGDLNPILGMGMDGDGMPLPAGAPPPVSLAGKELAFFREVIERGREHLRIHARPLADERLGEEVRRQPRPDLDRIYDRRWVLYHLVEHFAGHYGQILMLRHLYRDRSAVPSE